MKRDTFLKILTILLLCFCWIDVIWGQISQGGQPYSFKTNLKGFDGKDIVEIKKNIPIITMLPIEEIVFDSIKQNNLLYENYQFAYGFNVSIDVKKSAVVDSLDIGLLYRLSIKSNGAKSINLIFKKYILPRGARLFIYNKNKQYIIGAFTSNNNKQSEKLPTLPVLGEEIIIEYFEPYFPDFSGQLVIGKVNHDFMGLNLIINDTIRDAGSCHVNINCSPEGDNWQTEKRAVCKIIISGTGLCSGTLLNNTNQDGVPYFLTANHCVNSQSVAEECLFIFNYESSACNGNNGSAVHSISASTLRATNYQSDFTLLEFSHKPLSSWNPYYAGWDRNNLQEAGGVCIHHPKGDVKKISTYSMIPITSYCISGYSQNNFYLIDKWIATPNGHGVTEGGGSGSPLFNNAHRVIGQLYGGCSNHNDNCNNPLNDYSNYGKLCISWDLGGNSNNQLKNWLDPISSNETFLDGANVCSQGMTESLNLSHTIDSGVVEIYQVNKNIHSMDTLKTGAKVSYEAGKDIVLISGFIAEYGSDFIASVQPFNCVQGCHPMSLQIINTYFSSGGNLCFTQTNANSYSLKMMTLSGQLAFQQTGSTNTFQVCVPIPVNLGIGAYIVTLTLYSDCEELSETYTAINLSKRLTTLDKNTDVFVSNFDEKKTEIEDNEFEGFDFEIFPNPSDGNVSINIVSGFLHAYSVEVINATGKLIYKIENFNEKTIKINNIRFPAGIYFIRLNNGENIRTKKLIIL